MSLSDRPSVGVVDPTWIVIVMPDRVAFDRIAAPGEDIRNDAGRVLVKSIEGRDDPSVTVVFQHWLDYVPPERRAEDVTAVVDAA